MPIYKVSVSVYDESVSNQKRLVSAPNKARALAHAAKQHITIEVATPQDVHALAVAGVGIEEAAE